MAVVLLLLAAAVCVAPWRPIAIDRLALLAPTAPHNGGPQHRSPSGLRPMGRADASTLSALRILPATMRDALGRIMARRAAASDPGALAQLLDLMAAALTAGLPAPDALAAVADALEDSRAELAQPLRSAAARMRLGATPGQAWQDVPRDECLAPVAPVLVRACEGGGSVRAALTHAADRMRAEAAAVATARAERAAVMVAGPLGLCFLPAFVCLGVVPVVVGLAGDMLPGFGPGQGL